MKTRAIKFLVPVVAIVFAIATSAFTALDTPKADEFKYIQTNDPQNPCDEVKVDCVPQGDEECVYDSQLVYDMDEITGCNLPLFKRQTQ